jgi:K+-transporting ATPase A subunit
MPCQPLELNIIRQTTFVLSSEAGEFLYGLITNHKSQIDDSCKQILSRDFKHCVVKKHMDRFIHRVVYCSILEWLLTFRQSRPLD